MTSPELDRAAATPSPATVGAFRRDGFLVSRGLLDPAEVALVQQVLVAERDAGEAVWSRRDASGTVTKLEVRNDLGPDVFSAIARAARVVRPMEAFLAGEVYHYHHKVMTKEPHVGGAWEWHQDYGYWYRNGCLWPYMASCLIALDRHTRENGCLQVARGSHHMGRLDHVRLGDQTAADPERVAHALGRLEVDAPELEPGDAIFFHCNLLHRSDRNESDRPRLSLICCYNAARNDPCLEHHHPGYTPLEVWPDERVAEIARAQLATLGPRAG